MFDRPIPSRIAERGPRPSASIRLAFGLFFWRVLATIFVLLSAIIVLRIFRVILPKQRMVVFLTMLPVTAALSFFLAASMTVVADFVVRFLVRPRLLAWQAPRSYDDQASFHLEPRETIERETPARRKVGRRWAAGRLIATDRRVLFLANAWDIEPWSLPRARIRSSRVVEAPPLFLGLVRGVPHRFEIAADPSLSTEPVVFALPEPTIWAVSLHSRTG